MSLRVSLSPLIARILLGAVALSLILFAIIWLWLRQSLPVLGGKLETGHLEVPATIRRDAQGVALIESDSRNSSAFALGFLHAQERFFQMDLLRRNSAGELSELFGDAALEHDRGIRVHQFRQRAERNVAALPRDQRQLLAQYVEGVNYGLGQLGATPWEYALLGAEPRPWRAADSMLTIFSMYLTLQSPTGNFERRDTALAELLPRDLYQFFFPAGGSWDAPLIGGPRGPVTLPQTNIATLLEADQSIAYQPMTSEDRIAGSNNWVVGGALTEHGSAILADDMHLGLDVPNIWYRAGWKIPGTDRYLRGATLPGGPIAVVGSNGRVAWGFTNTGGDWSDLIPLELSEDGGKYRTPDGWRAFEVAEESIAVKGAEPETIEVRKTIWGPVVAENHRGRPLAYRWVAHDPRGANLNLLRIETVETAKEALDLGPQLGIPHQNLVVGDNEGHIGWTVGGAIPRRVGFDGSRSVSWADGDAYWDGYLSAAEQPRVYDPPSHRIWTANARTMDGDFLQIMGNQGYALGARQQQIRDNLFARDRFTEKDLLDIQLDDRAVFLQRWQKNLLSLLAGRDNYADVRAQVENWGGRASASSVGYRMVRNYRLKFMEYATAPVLSYMRRFDEEFSLGSVNRQIEYAIWEMASGEPDNLLNPDFESWQSLKLAALDEVLAKMAEGGLPLAEQTWGQQNTARIHHPLGRALSAVNWFTAMPAQPLSGDTHMPRVQSPDSGASERMVVAPGHMENAIFHMATGQSAHPLSPFFANGHEDWVAGNPSPLMEGEARYEINLQ
ncbi:penicillin acylase family protein [Microbulbifer halophilus]|uniref:Penicillin acylase family protein n=1 Tax=Microbulbifer halophilus TaxID=453963 RepID=A0ABW5EDH9_9GAMM|nr:penicillin acylase family protein [Microbulbifer halophilus]MCW8128232.1 penicillin acylase family protein [Microbulbifer halophilus]